MPKPRPEEPPAQPHDALVKWTFSQREHAAGLLRAALPPEVVAAVDWSTLRVEKDSFVDRALRKRYSDVLLSARIGEERAYFFTLIEHQRDVEPLMVFRVLLYMTRVWERLVLDKPTRKKLPLIIPVLLHHSKTGWTAATRFEDLIEVGGSARAAVKRHIPHFDVRLVDLSEGRAAHLVEQALTALDKVVLWCLSVAGDDERFARELGHIAAALDQVLASPDAHAALEVLLRYLAATRIRMFAPQVHKLVMKAVNPHGKEVIVTYLDEIELRGERRGELRGERRGERKGKREGKREALEQVLLRLLAARFGAVPEDAKARVTAATDATLEKWTLRVLTAPTLEAVLNSRATPAAPRRRAAPRKRPPGA